MTLTGPDRHPFLGLGGPIAFAHRGGAREAPENTMEAFAHAMALGYGYLETDVHVTRDGVVVVGHWPRLDVLTDARGAIAELTIAEVEAADAGFAFTADGGRSFPFRGRGVRIPRLEDVLTRWPEAHVNIDPKNDRCVPALVELLHRLDAWRRVCVGSFSDRRIKRVRLLSRGRACTSMGPVAVAVARGAAATGAMPRLGADCVQVPLRRGPITVVTRRFLAAAHRSGLPVHVWTVDEPAAMEALLDAGVDGLMSDVPSLLRDVFDRRGLTLGADGSVSASG